MTIVETLGSYDRGATRVQTGLFWGLWSHDIISERDWSRHQSIQGQPESSMCCQDRKSGSPQTNWLTSAVTHLSYVPRPISHWS